MNGAAAVLAGVMLAMITLGGAKALEGVTVTPLFEKTETASGQQITLPQKDIRVVVSTFDIAPGATLPVHKHPFARYALVQAGTLKVINTETDAGTVYKTGDFIIEMIGQWHRAQNVGNDPVKLLVIDQIEGTGGNTVLHRE